MSKRGPKPTPTPLKILRGTRKDRIPAAEPTPEPGRIEPPAALEGEAAKEWARIVPILEGMKVLTPADSMALALYCQAFARAVEAEATIRQTGMIIRTGLGGVKTNPAYAIAAAARAEMLKILAEFGCTPSSRSRIAAPAERVADELAEFTATRPKRQA